MSDGPIIIVSRAVLKHGLRDELDPVLQSVIEHDHREKGTLFHALMCERDDQHVIWGLTIYRDAEARITHLTNMSPMWEQIDGLLEQWPHPIYCLPLAAKVSDDFRDAWDTRSDDGPVIIV